MDLIVDLIVDSMVVLSQELEFRSKNNGSSHCLSLFTEHHRLNLVCIPHVGYEAMDAGIFLSFVTIEVCTPSVWENVCVNAFDFNMELLSGLELEPFNISIIHPLGLSIIVTDVQFLSCHFSSGKAQLECEIGVGWVTNTAGQQVKVKDLLNLQNRMLIRNNWPLINVSYLHHSFKFKHDRASVACIHIESSCDACCLFVKQSFKTYLSCDTFKSLIFGMQFHASFIQADFDRSGILGVVMFLLYAQLGAIALDFLHYCGLGLELNFFDIFGTLPSRDSPRVEHVYSFCAANPILERLINKITYNQPFFGHWRIVRIPEKPPDHRCCVMVVSAWMAASAVALPPPPPEPPDWGCCIVAAMLAVDTCNCRLESCTVVAWTSLLASSDRSSTDKLALSLFMDRLNFYGQIELFVKSIDMKVYSNLTPYHSGKRGVWFWKATEANRGSIEIQAFVIKLNWFLEQDFLVEVSFEVEDFESKSDYMLFRKTNFHFQSVWKLLGVTLPSPIGCLLILSLLLGSDVTRFGLFGPRQTIKWDHCAMLVAILHVLRNSLASPGCALTYMEFNCEPATFVGFILCQGSITEKWKNFFNLEDKVDFEGVGDDMVMGPRGATSNTIEGLILTLRYVASFLLWLPTGCAPMSIFVSVLHSVKSLCFKQWDPGGYSFVHWNSLLVWVETLKDAYVTVEVPYNYNLEDKVDFDGVGNVMIIGIKEIMVVLVHSRRGFLGIVFE